MPVSIHPLLRDNDAGPLRGVGLDSEVAGRLRSQFTQIRAQGDVLGAAFDEILLERAPFLRRMLTTDPTRRRRRLLDALSRIFEFDEPPRDRQAFLARLGRHQSRRGMLPSHYDMAIDAMTEAIRRALGDIATDDIERDWRQALRLVSDTMIAGAPRAPNR